MAAPPSIVLDQLTQSGVLVPKADEVAKYLKSYSQLGEHLQAICGETRQSLGANVELSLEVYTDPEIDDHYLTLYVRQDRYGPDIMDRLDAVSNRFEDCLASIAGNFLITTDFRRPRANNGV